MIKHVPLREIAVIRAGDKGDDCHIAIVPKDRAAYQTIWAHLTPEAVRMFFAGEVRGPVERYRLPNIECISMVLRQSLGGGVARGWYLDRRFIMGDRLMDFEVPMEIGGS